MIYLEVKPVRDIGLNRRSVKIIWVEKRSDGSQTIDYDISRHYKFSDIGVGVVTIQVSSWETDWCKKGQIWTNR